MHLHYPIGATNYSAETKACEEIISEIAITPIDSDEHPPPRVPATSCLGLVTGELVVTQE